MSFPTKETATPIRRNTSRRHQVHSLLECPECGVGMVEKTGKHGVFYGCQRFPLCVGTRPHGLAPAKPYDSFTQLLLDAHSAAVHFLAQSNLLGKAGSVAWWLSHQNVLTDMKALERAIEDASAKATELGYPKDFLQEEHDRRMAKIIGRGNKWKFVGKAEHIRSLPKPKFLRRWDTSDIAQLEGLYDKG